MTTIQQRRGTAAEWTAKNPVLSDGEMGVETDTDRFKIGDGIAAWSTLQYAAPGLAHTHPGADITGTGKSATTFLRGDGTWVVPTNTTYATATQAEIENPASTTGRLVSGERMWQGALKAMATRTTSDWDTATTNGWYMANNAANQPVSPTAGWFLGEVVAHNSLYITQTVHGFTSDNANDTQTWRRSSTDNAGVRQWTGWYRLRLSEAEQSALYALKEHAHAGATSTAAGFMSAADKALLDTNTVSAFADSLVKRDDGARIHLGEPVVSTNAATKGYVDRNAPGQIINPLASQYGLAANGTTDDGPAIQNLINSLPNYSIVEFPKSTLINIQTTVLLNRPITIRGGYFKAHTTGTTFQITSDNVTFEGNYLDGPGTAAGPLTTNKFITTNGTATDLRRNIKINRNTMRGSRYSFMWLHNLRNFEINENDLQYFQYSGITTLSAKEGVINFNTVRFAIMGGTLVNAYGIAVTDETNDEAGRAENIRIVGNYITDILKWEAIDTHGGKGVHILGNTMINVRQGVSLMTGNTTRIYPPTMCVVANNYAERGIADDTAWGLCLAGRSGDPAQTVGDGLASATIVNNAMVGYSRDMSLGRYDITLTSIAGNVSDSPNSGKRDPSHLPYRQYSDRATIALNGANAQTVQVVFPVDHFTQTPSVQLTKQSGAGAAYIPYVSTVDTTQVTVGIYSTTPASSGTVALSVECKQASPLSSYGNNRA
jgi:hypothetical protein